MQWSVLLALLVVEQACLGVTAFVLTSPLLLRLLQSFVPAVIAERGNHSVGARADRAIGPLQGVGVSAIRHSTQHHAVVCLNVCNSRLRCVALCRGTVSPLVLCLSAFCLSATRDGKGWVFADGGEAPANERARAWGFFWSLVTGLSTGLSTSWVGTTVVRKYFATHVQYERCATSSSRCCTLRAHLESTLNSECCRWLAFS